MQAVIQYVPPAYELCSHNARRGDMIIATSATAVHGRRCLITGTIAVGSSHSRKKTRGALIRARITVASDTWPRLNVADCSQIASVHRFHGRKLIMHDRRGRSEHREHTRRSVDRADGTVSQRSEIMYELVTKQLALDARSE